MKSHLVLRPDPVRSGLSYDTLCQHPIAKAFLIVPIDNDLQKVRPEELAQTCKCRDCIRAFLAREKPRPGVLEWMAVVCEASEMRVMEGV